MFASCLLLTHAGPCIPSDAQASGEARGLCDQVVDPAVAAAREEKKRQQAEEKKKKEEVLQPWILQCMPEDTFLRPSLSQGHRVTGGCDPVTL